MKVNLREVKAGYKGIKKLAFKAFEAGNYEKSLSYIEKASILATQIMWRYADEELDSLQAQIAEKAINKSNKEYFADSKKVVFYDYFGATHILTLQYIRALLKMNYEVLYIFEERDFDYSHLIKILSEYKEVTIEKINKDQTPLLKIQDIYQKIISFGADKLFLHINTVSACLPVLHHLPKEITKYYINLGDHAFWLGSTAIDYSFEFRSFGAVVSEEMRGLEKEQLLLLPYYPIVDKREFMGFPDEVKDKVIIFSGGDFYKTVDREDNYWKLCYNILSQNPNAVILYANKGINDYGNNLMHEFIIKNRFENRFIPIGFRRDINEVMMHCDIYMGTFPMSGGLMSQHAAINAKPILQFYPTSLFPFEETESMICFREKFDISFTDEKRFLEEAKRLIDSETYRKKQGKKLQDAMITQDEFDQIFQASLETHKTQLDIENISINYNALEQWWIDVNNRGYYDAGSFIYGLVVKNNPFSNLSLYIKRKLQILSNKLKLN